MVLRASFEAVLCCYTIAYESKLRFRFAGGSPNSPLLYSFLNLSSLRLPIGVVRWLYAAFCLINSNRILGEGPCASLQKAPLFLILSGIKKSFSNKDLAWPYTGDSS